MYHNVFMSSLSTMIFSFFFSFFVCFKNFRYALKLLLFFLLLLLFASLMFISQSKPLSFLCCWVGWGGIGRGSVFLFVCLYVCGC